MKATMRLVLLVLATLFAAPLTAQQSAWVQIEAHPDEATALERAEGIATRIAPLQGYRLSSGWYALAIGPLAPAEASETLRSLRITRQIPADSYIVDGGNFRTQFWPPEGTVIDTAAAAQPAPHPEPRDADETPAEARRSEAQLTREEREELQSALAWEGFYNSAIDGAIGRGTRNAMAEWQIANGFEATGVLTTNQRIELVGAFRDMLASIGIEAHTDDIAGISIDLPLARVAFDRYEPPFVHFNATDDSDTRVILISQSGDRATLNALYEVMQTLEIVPVDGPRRLLRESFSLVGENDRIYSETFARVSGGDVKGFTLVWPADETRLRDIVLGRMKQSFTPIAGTVLPDEYGTRNLSTDFLSGLAIRRPERSGSGLYVSRDGAILTAAATIKGCGRITLGQDDLDLTHAATDDSTGLALLTPQNRLSPIAFAEFRRELPRVGTDIAVSGYSFGRRLPSATLTFGTVTELQGLAQEASLKRLDIPAQPGDAGGPVIDASGAVLGLLIPRDTSQRVLPEDVHFAANANAVADFLTGAGITPRDAGPAQSFAPDDLASRAADMTALVSCWAE